MEFSIVVPVYNADRHMKKSLRRLIEEAQKWPVSCEILLRDDASTDRSRQVLTAFSREYPSLKVYFNRNNFGLGATLRKLFESAAGENIIYTDCDLPFGTDGIRKLIKERRSADVIVLSRYRGLRCRLPFSRRLASRAYWNFCRVLFGVPVRDIGSGTVLLKREVVERCRLASDGFSVHAELYARAQRNGFCIREIPYQSEPFQRGSFSIIAHGIGILRDTLKLWSRIGKKEEAVNPTGIPGITHHAESI